ncbi:AAA family ATPase [Anabaena cylindrica FACHB-243]|uniref:Plasmid segregation oscillating ATPase ParF n=1 Tax=Anabaena cylindrica (strain ATCC 27899 / PCC 7122) TaxID=272123 RepID=K9ZGZ4_ANACC|nr:MULTISPECIES: ParA family partition ATPase [Anabaena]AFZ57625.1 plasmid segregation oscillating ATPase ParF [Anabaena cylindrica PCC 7122]MBD2416145.1 AAA family ATPase [Anabaena cylindrica FACHB-243]MBY5280386.1 AAA family ATPase [Anabaena sp. CCAP 1446/1C]MBY5310027.1 AAA family ATPase [Anabaena sp. CCAP 1446/1C]MCM2409481.1 AAA family ATPase [Anabaena sp. CCAP 1446/1C]
MKIAILNQKGGSGKTTVSIHLSHALKLKGYRVLLVDTDPQGSSRDWAAARNEEAPFSVMALDRPIIHKELPKLAQGYEYVLIDGAPRVSDLTRSAIMAVDFVLIPIQPSPLDIWAVHEVVELIQEATIYKPDLSAAFLVNRKVVNSSIAREVSEVLQQYPFPVLNAQISQRVVFAECLNSGSTVLETAPKSAAADEVRAVCEEILAFVKEPTNHGRN